MRILSALTVAVAICYSASALAAPYFFDPEEKYSGGAPRTGKYGMSQVWRTTTSAPAGNYKPGDIVINTTERRLYLIQDGGRATRYGIGVGRAGFQWAGVKTITAKKEWPAWSPPPQMHARVKGLPAYMKGGEDNPLGARAMYLGSTLYRIHGTIEPETIGEAVSSGCFRMTNEDVVHLYDQVSVGTTVYILR